MGSATIAGMTADLKLDIGSRYSIVLLVFFIPVRKLLFLSLQIFGTKIGWLICWMVVLYFRTPQQPCSQEGWVCRLVEFNCIFLGGCDDWDGVH